MCFIDRNGYETWYDVMLLNSICFTTVMLPLHRFIRLYLSDLNEIDSLSRNGNQRRSNRIRSIAIAHEPPSGLIQRSGEDGGQRQRQALANLLVSANLGRLGSFAGLLLLLDFGRNEQCFFYRSEIIKIYYFFWFLLWCSNTSKIMLRKPFLIIDVLETSWFIFFMF